MVATRRLIAGLGLSLAMLTTPPASSETIQLKQQHGVFMLPVRINDAITIPFILDSGASEVVIPVDVLSVLRRAGTISQSDFIGSGTYVLADGSTTSSDRYVLHKMAVGSHVISNVVANVAPVRGDPLLGQSFLSKLPGWAVDNARHALVLKDEAETAAGILNQLAALQSLKPPASGRVPLSVQQRLRLHRVIAKAEFLAGRR